MNVSAGFHNHIGDTFAEIHACLVNGTGQGGMSWATVPDADFDPEKPDKDKYSSVVVPSMAEHGPLWRTSADGMPLFRQNRTVDYPWHGEYWYLYTSVMLTILFFSMARRKRRSREAEI